MAKDDLDNNEEEIHVLFNIWQTQHIIFMVLWLRMT